MRTHVAGTGLLVALSAVACSAGPGESVASSGWTGSTAWPAQMKVDYVRVYEAQ